MNSEQSYTVYISPAFLRRRLIPLSQVVRFGPDREVRHRAVAAVFRRRGFRLGAALEQAGLCLTAFGAHEPFRPAPLKRKACAIRLTRKPALEIEEGGVLPGHPDSIVRSWELAPGEQGTTGLRELPRSATHYCFY